MSKDIYKILIQNMKRIEWAQDKQEMVLNDPSRVIDFEVVAEKIRNWEIIRTYIHPNRPHQLRYVINYNGYPCTVPTVEDEEKIFIKSARLDRKEKL